MVYAGISLLESHGLQAGTRAQDRDQQIHIRLLQAILLGGNDPDDRLSKGDLSGFALHHRVELSIIDHPWLVLNNLMESGLSLAAERQQATPFSRASGDRRSASPRGHRSRQKYQLRVEQPW